jgi:hypothetical protein
MNTVYLDTSIWNVLCDQNADALQVVASLAALRCRLAIGINAYVELLNSFFGKRPHRGRPLLQCLNRFIEAGVLVADSWEKWLVEEADIAIGGQGAVSFFLSEREQRNIASWTKGLLQYEPPRELKDRLAKRREQTTQLCASARNALVNQPDILAELRGVDAEELAAFLELESRGARGQSLLAKYLPQVFSTMQKPLLTSPHLVASTLLSSKTNRASFGVVRSDIFRNWRAAQSDEIRFRACVPEDSYHVANASYFDVFVTEDTDGQADAAKYAVPDITVLVYRNREIQVLEWLRESLATSAIL